MADQNAMLLEEQLYKPWLSPQRWKKELAPTEKHLNTVGTRDQQRVWIKQNGQVLSEVAVSRRAR